MKFYRITTCEYANDLSGEGAFLYGGRWNSKGVRLLYTAEHGALAMLEALAHITMSNAQRAYCRVVMEIGDGLVGHKPIGEVVREVRETRTSASGEGLVGLVGHQPTEEEVRETRTLASGEGLVGLVGHQPTEEEVRETRTTASRGMLVEPKPIGEGVAEPFTLHDWYLEIKRDMLPDEWRTSPGPDHLRAIGDAFAKEGKYLAMKVPSVVEPESFNYLFNPNHALFSLLKKISSEPVSFDQRLLRVK
jgi:RES domain-containing protein